MKESWNRWSARTDYRQVWEVLHALHVSDVIQVPPCVLRYFGASKCTRSVLLCGTSFYAPGCMICTAVQIILYFLHIHACHMYSALCILMHILWAVLHSYALPYTGVFQQEESHCLLHTRVACYRLPVLVLERGCEAACRHI